MKLFTVRRVDETTEHTVTLETASPEGLWETLKAHPRVTAQYVDTVKYGWPTFKFTGTRSDLEAMIRDQWDDGGGDLRADLCAEIRPGG